MQQNEKPTVMIGTVVQNKIWSINHYLMSLCSLDYPKDKISLVFYVNDSTDGTKEELVKFLKPIKEKNIYRRIKVVEENWKYKDERKKREMLTLPDKFPGDANRTVSMFAHFARIRNRWLSFLEDEEYIFSVDADVILTQPFTLNQLIEADKDAIAAPVDNAENRLDGYDPAKEVIKQMLKDPNPKNREFAREIMDGKRVCDIGPKHYWNFGMLHGSYYIPFEKTRKVFPVDVTGACILIKRKVIDEGVNYGQHFLGEDLYFCIMLKSFGMTLYVDGTLETIHCMDKVPDDIYERCPFLYRYPYIDPKNLPGVVSNLV